MVYYPYMAKSNQRSDVKKKIGDKIREIREKKGMTQEEVAEKTGDMKANYFAKIERGLVNTSPKKLYQIAKALGVDVSEIFPD